MSNFADPRYYPRPMTPQPSVNSRAMKWIVAGIIAFITMLLGLLIMLYIGATVGLAGLIVGMILATLPVPIYAGLALWLDRVEAEPPWMLFVAFLWGATASVLIALIFQISTGELVAALASAQDARLYGLVVAAPVSEELAKAIVLFAFFFWKKDEFDGIIDGIVYATMVALGFAMTENIIYYGAALTREGGGVAATFIARGIFSPYAHPLFTSMTGIGLGWARQTNSRALRFITPVVGVGLAIFMHMVWNGSVAVAQGLQNGLVVLAMYGLIMVPAFFGVLLLVLFSLSHERRIVREHLWHDTQRGALAPAELEYLCTLGGRMSGSWHALQYGGLRGWRARRKFNLIAAELAFHRRRVARGHAPADHRAAEREAMYWQLLHDLRQRFPSR